jgi:cell division protein ZapA
MAAITVADDLSEARRRIDALESELARLRSASTAGDERMQAVESQIADGIVRAAERIERLARALNPTQPSPSA